MYTLPAVLEVDNGLPAIPTRACSDVYDSPLGNYLEDIAYQSGLVVLRYLPPALYADYCSVARDK